MADSKKCAAHDLEIEKQRLETEAKSQKKNLREAPKDKRSEARKTTAPGKGRSQ